MDKDILTNSPDDTSAETRDQQDKSPTSAECGKRWIMGFKL